MKNFASYILYLLQPLVDLRKHPGVLPSLPLQLLPLLFSIILLLGLSDRMEIRGIKEWNEKGVRGIIQMGKRVHVHFQTRLSNASPPELTVRTVIISD